ncbi:MAG: hypothetical protein ACOH1L_03165, partial [Thermomonas sp.]
LVGRGDRIRTCDLYVPNVETAYDVIGVEAMNPQSTVLWGAAVFPGMFNYADILLTDAPNAPD